MFSTHITHSHPTTDIDAQIAALEARIVPLVKSQPGFLSGQWSFDKVNGASFSTFHWDSKESAQRFIDFIRAQAGQTNPFGIKLTDARLAEIVAEAHAAP